MSAVLYPDALAASKSESRTPILAISKRWRALLIIGDLLMFLGAAVAATLFVHAYWNPDVNIRHVEISTGIYAVMWLAVFWPLGLYLRSFASNVRDEMYFTFAALCIGAMPLFIIFTIIPSISTSRITLFLSMVFSIVTVGLFRSSMHKAHDLASRQVRLVVVGAPEGLDGVVERLRLAGNNCTYWLAVRDLDASLGGTACVSTVQAGKLGWFRQALLWHADQILFTEFPPAEALPYLLEAAAQRGITLGIAEPRIVAHSYTLDMEKAGTQVLIVPEQLASCIRSSRIFKRMFDLFAVAFALMIFAVPMLVVALLLALDRSGPIFYTQARVGRDGKAFNMLKFRSMKTDAEAGGAQFAVKGDQRVTKLGRILRRTSLDELPQMINVLRGDMSIVGPRPERPVFVKEFAQRFPHYDERHLVKPGITGWSQVNMRRVMLADDVAEKLKHDLFYVENWSPFLDISVLTKTASEFLFHRAA